MAKEMDHCRFKATLIIIGDQIEVDFEGTAEAVPGNVNAVPAIVESAVAYCIRCVSLALLDLELPMNAGMFKPITVKIPDGSLLNPKPPHAVAAGNVETSQRVVDVVLGALYQALPVLIPAASQGTMNNLTFGGSYEGVTFAYYETIGGGAGAGPDSDGGSGIHVHMSNTLNTPIEALEYNFPLRVQQYRLRRGSGGTGKYTRWRRISTLHSVLGASECDHQQRTPLAFSIWANGRKPRQTRS